MISVIVLISLLIGLLGILYQDFKNREVFISLFFLVTFLGMTLFFYQTSTVFLGISIGINIFIVVLIVLVLHLYAKLKMKMKLTETIGLGDIFFFVFLACSFPTITFLTLFSSSLIFSLVLYLILKANLKDKTVPLAGFQSLFISIVLLINELFYFVNLYAI